jgi:mono/diheme cytochrome c family protein
MDVPTATKKASKTTAPTDLPMGEELPPPAGKEPSEAAPMQVMAGKKIYDSLDCSRCHVIGTSSGSGFRKGPRGPSLARVGADANHTVEWLTEQIRDPRSHRPASRMPPYGEDKISREDLRSLAQYLASLK